MNRRFLFSIISILTALAMIFTCSCVSVEIQKATKEATDPAEIEESPSSEDDVESSKDNETATSIDAADTESAETEDDESTEDETESETEETEDDSTEESTEPEESTAPSLPETEPSVPETQPPAPTSPPAPAVTSIDGIALVNYLRQFVGVTPYLWGGEDLVNGADCSGVVVAVYRHFGVNLPHYSGSLTDQGNFTRIPAEDALPGDIVGRTGAVGIFCGYIEWQGYGYVYVPDDEGWCVKSSDLKTLVRNDRQTEWQDQDLERYIRSFEYIEINTLNYYYEIWGDENGNIPQKYNSVWQEKTIRQAVTIEYTSETPGTHPEIIRYDRFGGVVYRPVTNTANSNKCPFTDLVP